jgi:hypothetical protein
MRAAWIELVRAALVIGLQIGCGGETRVSLFETATPVVPDAAPNGDGAVTPDAIGDAPAPVKVPIHRYDFRGTGTVAADRVSGAHGRIHGGATLDGQGSLLLDGRDDYVDLPNGLISSLNSATFVVWVEWYDGRICWQRIFDFGSTVQGEDVVGDATSNVFVTPLDCPGPSPLAMFGNLFGGVDTQVVIQGPVPFPVNVERQVALVVNGDTRMMQFYIDAQSHGEVALRVGFEGIEDVNNWIGRSQWIQDWFFYGRFEEFRIYDEALTAVEITLLHRRGRDAL